ncbi:EamA family transporter [Halomonas faecis]|uniref:EamA family transporter n=1 Tax=Halomonas faecis TaxID=1562110 RepID=UPI0013D67D8B|nr:EamA family transporter [Halomonas faecis]
MLRLVLPVIIIWGCNFAVMRIGVHEVGPFTLAALRFFIASVPLIFFIRRPRVPFIFIVVYSMTFGFGQFGLLFVAIWMGLPSGMASLLVQLQVVFTPLFALLALGQRIPLATGVAIIVSLCGLGFILSESGVAGPAPIILGVAAAMSWGASNVVVAWGSVHGLNYNPVSLVIWASAFLPIPFGIMAGVSGELSQATIADLWSALPPAIYLGLIATVMAYHFWVKAIATYTATAVAPFSLLIPIIGIYLGNVLFDEALGVARMTGSALIIVGIVIHMAGVRVRLMRESGSA